jgi:bacteriocin-like protein
MTEPKKANEIADAELTDKELNQVAGGETKQQADVTLNQQKVGNKNASNNDAYLRG